MWKHSKNGSLKWFVAQSQQHQMSKLESPIVTCIRCGSRPPHLYINKFFIMSLSVRWLFFRLLLISTFSCIFENVYRVLFFWMREREKGRGGKETENVWKWETWNRVSRNVAYQMELFVSFFFFFFWVIITNIIIIFLKRKKKDMKFQSRILTVQPHGGILCLAFVKNVINVSLCSAYKYEYSFSLWTPIYSRTNKNYLFYSSFTDVKNVIRVMARNFM